MKHAPPAWAMRRAEPSDLAAARDARKHDALQVKWPDRKALKEWAKQRGWPVPWLAFESAFLGRMLEEQDSFTQVLGSTGIELRIPREEVALSRKTLAELDELSKTPVDWDALVEELREIRRAVEAGVVVRIGDATLRTWQEFYTWAHGRYHALEDGCDKWIGDDRS